MRGEVICQQDSPIATFFPGFQVRLQKVYDVLLTIAALWCQRYCKPVWEPATAAECLQAFIDMPLLCTFEHAFGIWHLTPHDYDETRICREVSCPSRSHICTALDNWHRVASNTQSSLVLTPRLVVMKGGLVEVENHWFISVFLFDQKPNPE